MRSSISHVIFDVDGLLLDTESVYTSVSSELLAQYGLRLTYNVKRKLMGRKPLESATVLVNELSAPFTPEEWMSMCHQHLTPDRWHTVSSLPGADRLVLHLAKHNIPMAAATGCCYDELKHKMHNHPNIWKNLDHVVASGDDPSIARGKPEPDIFLAAASRFRNPPVNLDSVLVFEDSPLGVQAAAAAKMHVVWVPCAQEPPGDVPENVPLPDIVRVKRIRSLLDFHPEQYGIPGFD